MASFPLDRTVELERGHALGREGVAGWRPIDRTSNLWFGYTCELGFEDDSTERIENTARWPLAVASIGIVLTIAAMPACLVPTRSGRPAAGIDVGSSPPSEAGGLRQPSVRANASKGRE